VRHTVPLHESSAFCTFLPVTHQHLAAFCQCQCGSKSLSSTVHTRGRDGMTHPPPVYRRMSIAARVVIQDQLLIANATLHRETSSLCQFMIHRGFAITAKIDGCIWIYQEILGRFSQSFHSMKALCVQMIDLALGTVRVENFYRSVYRHLQRRAELLGTVANSK